MNSLRRQFLAGTGLAGDQHRGIPFCDLVDVRKSACMALQFPTMPLGRMAGCGAVRGDEQRRLAMPMAWPSERLRASGSTGAV